MNTAECHQRSREPSFLLLRKTNLGQSVDFGDRCPGSEASGVKEKVKFRTKEDSNLEKTAGPGAQQDKGSGSGYSVEPTDHLPHVPGLSRRTEAIQHESGPGSFPGLLPGELLTWTAGISVDAERKVLQSGCSFKHS